jgi:hypothetical protein
VSAGVAVLWVIGSVTYALVGLHVAFDVAQHNRGMLARHRQSPWLRGAFWFAYAIVGFILTIGDRAAERRR